MIDLHAHTTASDGSLTPAGLVALAGRLGLRAIAITDHDTVEGVAEGLAAGAAAGVEVVPGIELSVDYPHGEFHLLGYYLRYDEPAFRARLHWLQENRMNRNAVMVRRMNELGFAVTLEEIEAESGGGQVGRPHMARALLRKGYVASVQEAFDRYLADGRPLHVPKVKLLPGEAIRLVHEAGGLAVLAHPKYIEYGPEELAAEVGRLRSLGLDGLECYYSQHTEVETALYLQLAARYGLLITGGSDFHGVSKPEVPLGVVFRGAGAPDELLTRLRAAAGSR